MAPALRHTAGGPISLMPPVSKVLLRAVSYVPNWKMAGTKHCALVSYECRSSPRIFKARHFVRARYLARNAPPWGALGTWIRGRLERGTENGVVRRGTAFKLAWKSS